MLLVSMMVLHLHSLAGEDAVKKYNLNQFAEVIDLDKVELIHELQWIRSYSSYLKRIKICRSKNRRSDLVELNEAFAAQSLGVIPLN